MDILSSFKDIHNSEYLWISINHLWISLNQHSDYFEIINAPQVVTAHAPKINSSKSK